MRTGIIGLPQSGKTSLFKILTHSHAAVGFGAHQTHIGVARVPDRRVDELAKALQPKKTTYATVEYLDVPAISKENLQEAAYLGGLREVDALAHVVRLFGPDADSLRDIRNVEAELVFSDLVQVEKRLERLERERKKVKSPESEREFLVLGEARRQLEAGKPLRELELGPEEKKRIRGFQFLSEKSMLHVLNAPEQEAASLGELEERYQIAGRPQTAATAVCGSLEADIAELPEEEAGLYRESYGLKESGLERLIRATYSLLGLISFITVDSNEIRAWTLPRGSTALDAAAAVHTDLAKHFIRAEVVDWSDLVRLGTLAAARQAGVLRVEGKESVVKDGEVVHIRHSG